LDRLELLHEVADAVGTALRRNRDLGPSGRRSGQYALDLVADSAALPLLRTAGFSVLSEESGFEPGPLGEVVVIDPVDGSTNASRGVPWYATSLCVVDGEGPLVALVVNQATGERFLAERGGGAWCGDEPMRPSTCTRLSEAVVGVNGLPPAHYGWAQFRALGAAALDLCAVAAGVLDGYVDADTEAHGVWDYLGGLLICAEAGASVADAGGRDLVVLDHAARRTPIAAATEPLLSELVAARRGPLTP
jgi:fructose-1,6-bisphosphatase/inositol monophosphatase family enzyme